MSFKMDSWEEGGSRRIGTSLAEINVIPLVDVVLVLLLIFMLTAPMIYRGIDVNLPKSGSGSKSAEMEERMILTLSRDRSVYINEKKIQLRLLDLELKAAFKDRKDKILYLKADEELPYGFIVEMMDGIKGAGVEKIGMVTESKNT